ncbi:MAG: hypothetical protein COS35_10485 [Zetaproteobacteria bacterium CG02_land_8_20_14_3_00_50_9]|nr:MAG: hypothetical protein COS35_10485 [Zetaproteobacteria bacterium CG02_land_8_20_14_3_00_50_9]
MLLLHCQGEAASNRNIHKFYCVLVGHFVCNPMMNYTGRCIASKNNPFDLSVFLIAAYDVSRRYTVNDERLFS